MFKNRNYECIADTLDKLIVKQSTGDNNRIFFQIKSKDATSATVFLDHNDLSELASDIKTHLTDLLLEMEE